MYLKPMKKFAFVERLYEEEKHGQIYVNNGRSRTNPFIVKVRIIEDNTKHKLSKETLVFCRFVGLQDVTGDETHYLVHEDAMEAVLENE